MLFVHFTELPSPIDVQSFCVVCVWTPPSGRFDTYSGYDVRYFNDNTGEEIVVNTDESEFFQLTSLDVFSLGPQDQIMMQVS